MYSTSIPLPHPPHIISHQEDKATFVIKGFYPGYGITIANALRRIILSSLVGAAVVAVKIKDVDHEFSTIPGVLEDVIHIILQLKKIRFEIEGEGVFEGHLKIKGEKEINAGDFKIPSEVSIKNPDLRIATITDKKADLEMTIWVTKGIGYEPSEEHSEKLPIQGIGVLKVDSIFTPIVGANFKIEDMRIGEQTDYNKVTFSVETDGTITPQYAFEKAVETLLAQLEVIKHIEGTEKIEGAKKKIKQEKEDEEENDVNDEKEEKDSSLSGRYFISHLKLSSRIEKILKKQRVKTIGQLGQKKEDDLLKIEGIGEAAVKEIKRKLGKIGFLLKN